MNKDPHFVGQPALAQLMKYLPSKTEMDRIARKTKTNHYYKTLTAQKQLTVLLLAVLGHCNSLRELEVEQEVNPTKLQHIGLDRVVYRSTLSDANKKRSPAFFKQVFEALRDKFMRFYSDSRSKANRRLIYALDSTTISLFVDVFEGTSRGKMNGKKKGGVKVHTVYNVNAGIPEVVHITDAVVHDAAVAEQLLKLEPGSIVLFDRGYLNFALFEKLTKAHIHFVTRAKKNTVFKALAENKVTNAQGEEDPNVLFDQTGVLGKGKKGTEIRRVVYYNGVSLNYDVNLTNLTDLEDFDSKQIHDIYRLRWKIEELFKLIKQNYNLTTFLGNSRNAIIIQIYVILIAFILTMTLREHVSSERTWAYSVMVACCRLIIMNYVDLESFFRDPGKAKKLLERRSDHDPTRQPLFPDFFGD